MNSVLEALAKSKLEFAQTRPVGDDHTVLLQFNTEADATVGAAVALAYSNVDPSFVISSNGVFMSIITEGHEPVKETAKEIRTLCALTDKKKISMARRLFEALYEDDDEAADEAVSLYPDFLHTLDNLLVQYKGYGMDGPAGDKDGEDGEEEEASVKEVAKLFVEVARSKTKNDRSKFYSKLMGALAGDRNLELFKSFVQADPEAFEKMWGEISELLIADVWARSGKERPKPETAKAAPTNLSFETVSKNPVVLSQGLFGKLLSQNEAAVKGGQTIFIKQSSEGELSLATYEDLVIDANGSKLVMEPKLVDA